MRFAEGRCWILIALFLPAITAGARSSSDQQAMDWIRKHAIPLNTVEAGHGFDDMQPLGDVVGDARIVALGEATHGTREFFQLKHRMLEFLASQKGFTIFSIEANMPEAYRLNDFVLNGTGDPKQLLRGMYFWTWDTEEVLDMILWMREFNRSRKGELQFTGFDMQTPDVAMQIVRSFVAGQDKTYGPALDLIYEEISESRKKKKPGLTTATESPSQLWSKHVLVMKCRELVEHLERGHAGFLQSGLDHWNVDWVIQNARIVLQYAQLESGEQSRDRSMAENVKWIADHNPGAKIVLWAHNGHVKYWNPPGFDPMGGYLHEMFGHELVNFGFSFNEGSFRAIETPGAMRTFTVAPLLADSLDRTLASTNIPLFALDLRQVPKNGPVAQWFSKEHAMRSIGAVYSEKDPESPMAVSTQRWPNAFDAIFFVEKTTASRTNH